MSNAIVALGLAVGAIGFGGRYLLKHWPSIVKTATQKMDAIPGGAAVFSKYYRGGFEKEMSRREASLILGISPSANANRIKEAHKRIMIINHPDKGGSPYLAAKINEAKEKLEQKTF